MSPSSLSVRFAPSARWFLAQQRHDVVNFFIDQAVWLKDHYHLSPDDGSIRPFLMPPVVGRVFFEGDYWTVFYIDANKLVIANVGHKDEEPHLWRRDALGAT